MIKHPFSPGRRLWRCCRKENQTVFSSMRKIRREMKGIKPQR
jgi:hypothetical protein